MVKRIVVLSDGTGNSSAKAQKTNVWRMFQALDQSGSDQIAFYDDGVGTSSNKYLALLGGVFGWGLKRNVIELYKFVCRNYEPTAEISGFGFSRGAFTIRVLVGLILWEGLVAYGSEEELHRNARAAYRHYRSKRFPSHSPLVWLLRHFRDGCLRAANRLSGLPNYAQIKKRTNVKIRFLGLWDTVSAYGVPILPLKRAIDATIWPMVFGDLKLHRHVRRACHALSLDDERSTFHPLLWDESDEEGLAASGHVDAGRITQIWFPGVHCNVGGGYPEDRLSLVSLHWMMSEAVSVGLVLLPSAVDRVIAEQSPYARIYDSRSGFAGWYPYLPRLALPCTNANQNPYWPLVHSSVLLRIKFGTDHYAPIALRDGFHVVDAHGGLLAVPPDVRPIVPALIRPPVVCAPLLKVTASKNAKLRATLQSAMPNRSDAAMQLAWDTVFWRRVAYLSTLVITILLLLFPQIWPALDVVGKRTGLHVSKTDGSMIADDAFNNALNVAKGFLPTYSTAWTDAFANHSNLFGTLAAALIIALLVSSSLRRRVHDRAEIAWHASHAKAYLTWRVRSEKGSRNMTLASTAVVIVLASLSRWHDPVLKGANLQMPRATTVELSVLAVILVLVSIWRILRINRLKTILAKRLQGTFALRCARGMRQSPRFRGACLGVERVVLPGIFLLACILFGVACLNRGVFDGMNAIGTICTSAANPASAFMTSDPCWNSNIELKEGARYQIDIRTNGDWLDRSVRADVGGFPTAGRVYYGAALMRRWWYEDWLKPIARIGRFGHDEYVLEPLAPYALKRYRNNLHKDAHQPTAGSCTLTGGPLDQLSASEAACIDAGDPTPVERDTLTAQFTAKSGGMLYLYLNDAVAPLIGHSMMFYENNYGCGEVTVSELLSDNEAVEIGHSATCSPPVQRTSPDTVRKLVNAE